jgi:hypothetical protein
MFEYEKDSSIGHSLVLILLWFVNILILIFGAPFLIFKKMRDVFFKSAPKSQPKIAAKPESAPYFPCRVD